MTPSSVTKLGDPTQFALGALDIYRNGWIQPENQWLVKLWPPGFMVIEGLILKMFGIDAPFIFILILLNSALVALLLLVMRLNLLAVNKPPLAALLPLAPFLFPVTRLFLLEPSGIILGEGFSIAFFMTSMLLVPMAIRSRSLKCGALAGLTLAFAAYFRSQFDLIVTVLTSMAILFAVAYFLFFKARICGTDQQHMTRVIKTITIMLFVAHATMMPWRLHNQYEPSTGNTSWVQTQTLVFTNAGRTDKDLIEAGGAWIVQGGGNVACKVEPSYCGKSEKAGFYQAFMNHPIDWFLYKYEALPDYWFSSLRNFANIPHSATAVDLINNLVILFFVFFNLALLLKIRRHPDFPVYAWQCFSFYVCSFCIFLFVHYETRYFYALKIYGIFTFISLSAIAWRLSRFSRAALPSEQAAWFRYA